MNSTLSSQPNLIRQSILYSSLLLVVFGLPGNILMFVVFSRQTLSKLSVSFYFRAMSIANIFININWLKKFSEYQYGFVVIDQSDFLCKSVMFTIYTISGMAAWFMVVAGLDRFFVIVYPTRFLFVQKPRFSQIICVLITIYNIIFNFHILFDTSLSLIDTNDTDTNTTLIYKCEWPLKTVFYFSVLVNSTIIPFAIMTASTIGMCLVVNNSRNRMKQISNSSSSSDNARLKKMRDLRFTVTMIVMNVFFLVLNALNPFFNALEYLDIVPEIVIVDHIATGLFYTFYSTVFYVQLGVNNLVRKQFLAIFRPRRQTISTI